MLIKALCRRIEARYGSGKAAAFAANVSPGVWSQYCSDDHPDTTIGFHRIRLVANASERAAFAALLLDGDEPAPGSLATETSEATEAAALFQSEARQAGENITPLKARSLNDKFATALVEIMDCGRALPKAVG
jgi:hypothetical protein